MSGEPRWIGRLLALGLCAALALVTLAGDADAQSTPGAGAEAAAVGEPVALPDPMTRATVRDLLARLSDAQARELLLAELDRAIVAEPAQRGLVGELDAEAATLRESWRQMFASVVELPGVPVFLLAQLQGDRGAFLLLEIALGVVAIFVVGWAAEWLFRRLTKAVRRQFLDARPETTGARICYCLLRVVFEFLDVVIFTLATIGAFFVLYQGYVPVRLTVMTYVGAVFITRLVTLAARFLIAPHQPALRMLPLDDGAAQNLYQRIFWIAVIGAFGLGTVNLLARLGLDGDLVHLLVNLVKAAIVATLIALVWHAREPIARLIRGGAPKELPPGAPLGQRVRNLLAAVWHGFAIVYILFLWALAEVTDVVTQDKSSGAGLKSLLLIIAVPLIDAGIGQGINAYVAGKAEGVRSDWAAYGRIAHRALRILLIVLAIIVFASLWGVDLLDVAAGGFGERVISSVVDVGLTLLVAYVGWEIARIAIDRRLAVEQGPGGHGEAGGEGGGQGASRVRTLLPLFRKFLMITVAVMVIMLVLSSLGVDIGPLLAGAGVIGLAIGFGAQTLVRDIVSGVFFLMDDAFRLGEYVDIGGIRGTVEHISVRSLRLRHHRGALHTIPFGEIHHLTNHSRDWVIMKLMFRVPYDTDLMKVKKIFKKIGAEMMADPAIGPNLLDPPKSQGVLEIDDSAMVIRAKFMAKPGEQFVIRRELFQRVQQEFEAAGIQFARRQVSVYVPPGTDATAASAAAAVAEQEAAAKKGVQAAE